MIRIKLKDCETFKKYKINSDNIYLISNIYYIWSNKIKKTKVENNKRRKQKKNSYSNSKMMDLQIYLQFFMAFPPTTLPIIWCRIWC